MYNNKQSEWPCPLSYCIWRFRLYPTGSESWFCYCIYNFFFFFVGYIAYNWYYSLIKYILLSPSFILILIWYSIWVDSQNPSWIYLVYSCYFSICYSETYINFLKFPVTFWTWEVSFTAVFSLVTQRSSPQNSFRCNLIGLISNNDCDDYDWSIACTDKQRERNVVRKKAAICGEELWCVTNLKTAAKETRTWGPLFTYPDPAPHIVIRQWS